MAGSQELNIVIQAKNQAQTALNQVSGQLDGIKDKTTSISESMSSLSAGLATAGAGLTAGITLPILGLGKAAIEGAAKQEQLRVAFTTMLGDAGKAKTLIQDLQSFAAATPFEQDQVVEAGKKLLAFGTNAEDVKGTLTSLGDIAAGVGIPIQDLATIYGQAQVSGRLMTGDINQLVGRGVPIIQALAKELGVTQSQVRGLAEDGKISFEDFQGALKGLTSEGSQFGGMMDQQSKTLLGMWSTIKDQISITLNTIGEKLITTFNLNEKLAGAIEWLTKMRENITSFIENNPQLFQTILIFTGIAAAIGPVLIGLAGALQFFSFLAPAISAVGAVVGVLTSPLALVAIALGAILYYDVGGWGTAVKSAFGALYEFISAIAGSTEQIKWWVEAVQDAGLNSIEAAEAITALPTSLQTVANIATDAISAMVDLKDAFLWILQGNASNVTWLDETGDKIGRIFGLSNEAKIALGDFLNQGAANLQNFVNIIQAVFGPSLDRLKQSIFSFGGSFGDFGEKVKSALEPVLPILEKIGFIIGVALGVVAYLALNILIAAFDNLGAAVTVVVGTIGGVLGGFNTMLDGVIKVATSLLQGDFVGAWEGAKTFISGWGTAVIAILDGIKNSIAVIIGFIGEVIKNVLGDLGVDTEGLSASIKTIVDSITNFKWAEAPKAISDLVVWVWPEAPEVLSNFVKWVWPSVPLVLRALTTWVFPVIPALIGSLVAWVFPDASQTIKDLVKWAFPKVPDVITDLVDWDFPSVPDVLNTLMDWSWPSLPIPQSVLDWLGSSSTTSTPKQAVGASNWAGGPVIVGDGGPELIIPPRGTQILNNRDTRSTMASNGGGVTVNIYNPNVRGQSDVDNLVNKIILELNRRGSR